MIKKTKAILQFLLPIILLSLFVLWPSFNLHLTGDDYLSLWRYHYYLDGHLGNQNGWMNAKVPWNNISFFLTDYGPQDTFIAINHYFFGNQPQYYYLISFLFRILATCSFYPLIYVLTKNKIAAYCSTLFFAITATGLQTTDWSFNMPSYLAIALMNTFFFTYIKSKLEKTKRLFVLCLFLLYFSVIAQPIRMTFLPLSAVLLEAYFFLRNKINTKSIFVSLRNIVLFIAILIFIYLTGFIGNSVGAGETFYYRTHTGWEILFSNASYLFPYFSKGQYQILAYPIAMFGSLIFPTNSIPPNYEALTSFKAIVKLILPLFILFTFLCITFWGMKKFKNIPVVLVPITIGLIWSIFVYLFFNATFVKSQFITMLLGGYAVILLISVFIRKFYKKNIALGLVLGTLIVFLPFLAPWVRNPIYMYDSAERYLILPVTGFTLLLGIFLGSVRSFKNRLLIGCLFLSLIGLHMYTTFTYLHHLSSVRSIRMTESIRSSIPYEKDFNDQNRPIVYYFQPTGSEVLYHSLLFGFPLFLGYHYNFFNVWHFVYTDNWQEVVDAYKNGSSLKRFSIPIKKVPLSDIYSFQLDGDHLINTTQQTRKELNENK